MQIRMERWSVKGKCEGDTPCLTNGTDGRVDECVNGIHIHARTHARMYHERMHAHIHERKAVVKRRLLNRRIYRAVSTMERGRGGMERGIDEGVDEVRRRGDSERNEDQI